MLNTQIPFQVKGHVKVCDDLGNVLIDKPNAVHPQNMARVIARALSNEHNFHIHRIALGNGGTFINPSFQIEYNTPNDGQPPDSRTWDSRLYNETYSEIVDEGEGTVGGGTSDADLGTDPGSAGPNAGNRPGGGAVPASDPASVPHVSGPGVRSNELGLTSEVVITSVLNPNEPLGQLPSDGAGPSEDPDSSFTFDELGLYTEGNPALDSNASHDINVGNKTSDDDTGLAANTAYHFNVYYDDGAGTVIPATNILFTTPAGGGSGPSGEILYGDLCDAINTSDPLWGTPTALPGSSTMTITNTNPAFASLPVDEQTFGFLRFTSGDAGAGVQIIITAGAATNPPYDMVAALNDPTGGILQAAVDGQDAGVQNNPVSWTSERERLLTHIVFSPVLKAANRTLTITYTLTVSVARTTT